MYKDRQVKVDTRKCETLNSILTLRLICGLSISSGDLWAYNYVKL